MHVAASVVHVLDVVLDEDRGRGGFRAARRAARQASLRRRKKQEAQSAEPAQRRHQRREPRAHRPESCICSKAELDSLSQVRLWLTPALNLGASAKFSGSTLLTRCFQLAYGQLRSLLPAGLLVASSLLPACFQLASSLLPASLLPSLQSAYFLVTSLLSLAEFVKVSRRHSPHTSKLATLRVASANFSKD